MKNKVLAFILSASAIAAVPAAHAFTSSFYSARSVLASGLFVKVEVDTTGIYEISHEQLRELGFSNPEAVHVFGYGGIVPTEQKYLTTYPDDLPQSASMHTADGRLLFYAEGVRRLDYKSATTVTAYSNCYDSHSYYFLSDAPEAAAITTQPYQPSENLNPLSWSYGIDVVEREVQNPGKGSIFFHGPQLKAGQSEDFTFTLRDFYRASNVADGYFQFEAAILTPAATKAEVSVSPSIELTSTSSKQSTQTTHETTLFQDYINSYRFTVPGSTEGNVSATFTLGIPDNFAGSYAAIDKTFVIYPRVSRLGSRAEDCYNFPKVSSNQAFTISDASSDTEVWNVTDPTNIFRYELKSDDAAGTVAGSFNSASVKAPTRLYAFNPAATHRTPRIVGAVPNQNLHALRTPDMLIVANRSNMQYAEQLADAHRSIQGLDVHVVCQDEAFNEFSGGTRHPNGVRRLVKMFYDRDNTKLRYLVLFGHTTWDPRGIVVEPQDFLISFQCELKQQAMEHTTNYCSDFYFGMLADSFLPTSIYRMPTQISVGRIPASDATQAAAAVSKTKAYLENPMPVQSYLRTLFMSCEGDNNSHIYQSRNASDTIRATSDAFTAIHADNLLYKKDMDGHFSLVAKVIEQSLNNGVGYFNYNGHGNFVTLDNTYIWQFHHINEYRYTSWPFAMLSTCSTWPLDDGSVNITEKMLYQKGGGMVGALSACRSVYLEYNNTFNKAMALAYAEATDGTCYGDLPRIARNKLIADEKMLSSLGNNTMSFNYCGDPAVPISAPTHRVVVDEINGVTVAPGDAGTISSPGLSNASVKAHIVDIDGNTMSDFNGSATIEVFDTPLSKQFTCNKVDFNVSRDHEPIAQVSAQVVNGYIDAKVLVANPSAEGAYNRLTVVAFEKNGASAAGGTRALKVSASAEAADDVDSSAPAVEEMYVNSSDFVAGDIVSPDITLHAVVDPSASGVENRQTGINNSSSLTLDGNIRLTNEICHLQLADDGKMYLDVPLADLGYGRHTLTLKVVNRLGMSDTRTVDFNVRPDYAKATLTLDIAEEGPARNDVTIALDSYETDINVDRLLIVDSEGRTVLSRADVAMPFCWNLSDNAGSPVADGLYRAHAIFSTENTKGSTAPVEIVVLR